MWLAHPDGWYFLDTWIKPAQLRERLSQGELMDPNRLLLSVGSSSTQAGQFHIRPESGLRDFAFLDLCPGGLWFQRSYAVSPNRDEGCWAAKPWCAQCLVSPLTPLPSGGEWWSIGRTDFCNQRSRPFIQATCRHLFRLQSFRLRRIGMIGSSGHSLALTFFPWISGRSFSSTLSDTVPWRQESPVRIHVRLMPLLQNPNVTVYDRSRDTSPTALQHFSLSLSIDLHPSPSCLGLSTTAIWSCSCGSGRAGKTSAA